MICGGDENNMADLKLFRLTENSVSELPGYAVALEKSLQSIFEANLETLLGVTFLASEFSTTHSGRMDTLGIDENLCPVIIEYKRSSNENVVNQGLFYLDWLMDHRADFKLLVLEHLGAAQANAIEWSAPRLICIAGDFTKFDEHAIRQMHRNIELIRYRRFGEDLLLLDLLTATTAPAAAKPAAPSSGMGPGKIGKGVAESLKSASKSLSDVFHAARDHMQTLGDDGQVKELQMYHAFRRIKNFACMEIRPQAGHVLIYLKVIPSPHNLVPDFTRDMRGKGHYGTGDLEITLRNFSDLERAKPLILESYENS